MKEIKVGDKLYHPCSMDIIEHKVIAIIQYEGFKHYRTQATHNVGACGKVEVILNEHKNFNQEQYLFFIELIDEENIKYASGLKDFIEGKYYLTLDEAKLAFYRERVLMYSSRVSKAEADLKKAKSDYEGIKKLVNDLIELIKKQREKEINNNNNQEEV